MPSEYRQHQNHLPPFEDMAHADCSGLEVCVQPDKFKLGMAWRVV
jgi:hypothetical protein